MLISQVHKFSAQAAKTVATELKDDEAVAAKQKKEDPDEVAIESKDGEAMDVNQKEKDHEDKKSGTKGKSQCFAPLPRTP